MKNFNKYKNYFYIIFPFIFIFLIFTLYIYNAIDIVLCDDGNSSNKLLKVTDSYQAYRPGLQYTAEGYRYELPGKETYQELDGRALDNHPNSYESGKNIRYANFYKEAPNQHTVNQITRSSYYPEIGIMETESECCLREEETARHVKKLRDNFNPQAPKESRISFISSVVKYGVKGGIRWAKEDIKKTREKAFKQRLKDKAYFDNLAREKRAYDAAKLTEKRLRWTLEREAWLKEKARRNVKPWG